MRNHATASPDTHRPEFGLFTVGNDAPRVRLPLKAIDARFEVVGDCAQISMEQIFEFDGPNPVDVLYSWNC